MWVDVTGRERQNYMSQANGSFIPGTMVHFVTTLSLISAVFAFNTDRRCLLFDHKCISHCPRNMFPYHTRCDGQTMSQRTCDRPFTYVLGYTCGWSRCDCSGDLVLDEDNAYCVPLESCSMVPTKLPRSKTATERRRTGLGRLSKKIKFEKDELSELV